ncbi:unnamed protein product [Peniophora sp. CBMAI 1063]|nr:unnamed protein product [Peniophora sp. CBMAI 1063]
MLLLVLLTSVIRQRWNLGVAFLCIWLLLQNVTAAASTIIWADNADVKFYAYCDIASRIQIITYIVQPMATLLITRRLYVIASLQSVEIPSTWKRPDAVIEWTLGLFIPLLVAGPIYYVNQAYRFVVYEGYGCVNAPAFSILETLIQESWSILPPLVSVIFYYPRVVQTYYRQRRDINSILQSDRSSLRTNYLRILILASIDLVLTLPIAIMRITLDVVTALSSLESFPFYSGWTQLHANWEPVSFSYAEQQTFGTASLVQLCFGDWTSPILSFAIFGLFGVTSEARCSYWRIIRSAGDLLGWKAISKALDNSSSPRDVGQPSSVVLGFDLEKGIVNTGAPAEDPDTRAESSWLEGRGLCSLERPSKATGDQEAHWEQSTPKASLQSFEHNIPAVWQSSDAHEESDTMRLGSPKSMEFSSRSYATVNYAEGSIRR